jgi:hypothetical protein
MTRFRALLAYPIAYALVFAVMYAQAPGYPLKNAWNDWRRRT